MHLPRRVATLATFALLLALPTSAQALTFTPTSLPDVTVTVGASASGGTATWTPPSVVSSTATPGVVSCAPAAGSTFAVGDTTVTCTGNALMTMPPICFPDGFGGQTCMPMNIPEVGTLSFAVHVVKDATGPSIAALPNLSTNATSSAGAALAFELPEATDAAGVNAGSRMCSPGSGTTFAIGVTTVTCSAADLFGNMASTTFTVTVLPTTVPRSGTSVAETILGSDLADVINGLGGADVIRGLFGDDVLNGDAGNDKLFGGDGSDTENGGAGADWMSGGTGGDKLTGGLGIDTILGGPGNDLVYARGGQRDVIDCGTGKDIASVDRVDVVRNCEKVFRAAA